MRHRHSLNAFVNRTLIYRLIAVGFALSFLIGLTVFLMERERISQEVINAAVDGLSVFADRYSNLLDDSNRLDSEKIHSAFMEFMSLQHRDRAVSFVYAAIYDANRKSITSFSEEENKQLDAVKKKQQELNVKIPVDGHEQYEIVRAAGRSYLRIAAPFINKQQMTIGWVNGYFSFSDKTIAIFRKRGLRAMITAIVVVIITTAILYPVVLRLTRRITQFSVQLLNANLDTLETLGNAIAQRDSDTNAHNYRVSIYAARIGEAVGLSDQAMRALIKGSFLHDVGKIGIPDEILLKPDKLTDKEVAIMRTHVALGREIIQGSMWLDDALEVVLSHHETMAGKGYPRGIAGEAIPITARIFAIADVFDALTSKRPYKEAWPFEQAMETLNQGRGTQFDPFFLDAFNRIAKPLYDKFGGKEEIFQKELGEIVKRYFYEGIGSLEY